MSAKILGTGVCVKWPLMKVNILFTFCCNNYWKRKFTATEKPGKLREFFFSYFVVTFSAVMLLVGWQERHPACKNWAVDAGVVICLERGADLHMAQLIPLPLTVSCFSKIQTGFAFLVLAHLGSPGQRAIKRVYVCVWSRWCHVVSWRCELVVCVSRVWVRRPRRKLFVDQQSGRLLPTLAHLLRHLPNTPQHQHPSVFVRVPWCPARSFDDLTNCLYSGPH